MEMSLRIHEMQPHGRQIRAFAVLLDRIVRREETGTDHNTVKHAKDDEPSDEHAPHSHRALLSVRIRGSAQNRSKSASKIPPTTTYRSRARMASNNSGPSPGQLITTSMSSDPLNNAPMRNPKRDMRGLAAAGSA